MESILISRPTLKTGSFLILLFIKKSSLSVFRGSFFPGNFHERSILIEERLILVLRAIRIKFNNEIIAAFTDQDVHVILLHKLQHGQEEENSMEAVLANIEEPFERQGLLPLNEGQDMLPAVFPLIFVFHYLIDRLFRPLLDAHHH